MKIQGLQKTTLLDFPGKVACTIFLAGCNFQCPFCHNASLVTHLNEENTLSEEEIFRFLKKRQGLLDGVCITGGEPLLTGEVEAFIRRVKAMGYEVKIDTNGSNPDLLKHLVNEKLIDYVAMDLKNSKAKYKETAGKDFLSLELIDESVQFLLSDQVDYEFRTTVVREFHKREDFEEMGQWIKGAKRYYLQQFVDSGDLIVPGLHAYAEDILIQALRIVKKYVPEAAIRGI